MPNGDVYQYREPWRGPLMVSLGLHGTLATLALVAGLLAGQGEKWGEDQFGGAMSATLVTTVAPVQTKPVQTENVLANESLGLTESRPKVEETPQPEAIPIPEKVKPKAEKQPVATAREKPKPEKLESNRVPFGQGGPIAGANVVFRSETGTGGISLGPGGSFGTQFGWYVDVVRKKISENWMRYEVDPRVQSAPRVFVNFEINRTGEPENIRLGQSSGIGTLDQSALRAVQRVDTFGPLPPEYRGNRVNVEFWFEYRR